MHCPEMTWVRSSILHVVYGFWWIMYSSTRWLCMYICFLVEIVLIWIWGWGTRHFCKLFCLQTSFWGDFLVIQPNYYFVNCISINTNQVKRERKWWFFGFFRIKLMTSDTCSIIIRNCICDTLFNMMYSPSQIVPPVFNQVSKFNMAMNSKWKPTSKQVYNHFIFPMLIFFPPSFQVFPH